MLENNPSFLELIKKHQKDYIHLTATRTHRTTVTDSKILGTPFWLKDAPYPKNKVTGTPLKLLMQINFEQFPTLEGFPQNGIIQLFIDASNGYYDVMGVSDGGFSANELQHIQYWSKSSLQAHPNEILNDFEFAEQHTADDFYGSIFNGREPFKLTGALSKQIPHGSSEALEYENFLNEIIETMGLHHFDRHEIGDTIAILYEKIVPKNPARIIKSVDIPSSSNLNNAQKIVKTTYNFCKSILNLENPKTASVAIGKFVLGMPELAKFFSIKKTSKISISVKPSLIYVKTY